HGKPTRSGRSATGTSSQMLALDLQGLRAAPEALQGMVLHQVAGQLGVALEFKHIQQLMQLVQPSRTVRKLALRGGLLIESSLRELRFSLEAEKALENYGYTLPIPGEVQVPELGKTIRARVITTGKQKVSGYNAALLLNRILLAPELTVRNWRAGDRFFPAHSQSPKKVKELLQPNRLGSQFSAAERKLWPVIESAGEIVWMRGFPVSQEFAIQAGEAVLIEEI
ncbi:MAG TPA: tRNA lysidine(34) synthetase TilS, partial [Candidatus Sulfotelmatobacter sp.]|nr:tRNA lysidine(34) synthetase TilS [Candidatus Sulfotelmatobacter sp.]